MSQWLSHAVTRMPATIDLVGSEYMATKEMGG